jgi:hypothetical protein
MAVILDKTSKTVLVKLTIQEYKKMSEFWIFDDENIQDYDFVFEKPVKASDLLEKF